MEKLQKVMHIQISNLRKENQALRKDVYEGKKQLNDEKKTMAGQLARLQTENSCLQNIIKQYFDTK